MSLLNNSMLVPVLLFVILGLSICFFVCSNVYFSLKAQYDREYKARDDVRDWIIDLIRDRNTAEHDKDVIRAEARRKHKLWKKALDDLGATQARARLCDRAAMRYKWDKLMGNPVAKLGAWRSMSPAVAKGRMSEIFYKLQEELKETREAKDRCNITAFIDGITDIMYVCEATGIWLGVDMNKAFLAVHKSNMTKSPYLFRKDGKGKGYDFEEPDFSEAMRKRV